MGFLRNTLNWYARLNPTRGVPKPPYKHVTQIGDPILRRVSSPVDIDKINNEDIQLIVKALKIAINRYGSLGMSAPQIGVNMRIFAMQLTPSQFKNIDSLTRNAKGVEVIPLIIYINPELKVLDHLKVSYIEGCESIQGYEAEVPRYKSVQITGYSANGEKQTNKYNGWSARIAQHEMDHLDGKLYTDTMNRSTFQCSCWEEVNLSKGKVVMPFIPD